MFGAVVFYQLSFTPLPGSNNEGCHGDGIGATSLNIVVAATTIQFRDHAH